MTPARPRPQLDEAHANPQSGRAAHAQPDKKIVRSRLVAPILLLFVLGTLDAFLTIMGLAHGGRELNPYARLLLARGTAALVATRLATLLAASITILLAAPKAPRTARACLHAALLVFLLVDAFSLLQLVMS
jgi:hypothetical protein